MISTSEMLCAFLCCQLAINRPQPESCVTCLHVLQNNDTTFKKHIYASSCVNDNMQIKITSIAIVPCSFMCNYLNKDSRVAGKVYLSLIPAVASECSRNHFISQRHKTEKHHLIYIYFKIVPLCNCTLMPATIKLLETTLEAILWKPFQFFRRILNYVSSVTKIPPLQC